MNFRTFTIAFALLGIVASCDQPETVVLGALVGDTLELPSEINENQAREPQISWEFVEAPVESAMRLLDEDDGTTALYADKRGDYTIDRWVKIGAVERWSHRIFITISNAPPTAVISGRDNAYRNTTVTFGGYDSLDTETDSLVYQWRLSYRPRASDAVLQNPTSSEVSLTIDEPGLYGIELSVFDGELWSINPATFEFTVL